MSAKRFIPFNQPLSPLRVLRPGRSREDYWAAFGRVQHYYLARNAIWHGIGALGLGAGDVILTPAYHHGVEVEVLIRRGLKPRYYRVDERGTADVEHLAGLSLEGVRALYVTHYWGFPQPIEALSRFAAEHGLDLIEDCALSLYSRLGDRPLGTFGAIGVFCLYKSLPLPHGGTLVLNRPTLPLPPPPPAPSWRSTGVFLGNRFVDHVAFRGGTLGRGLAAATRQAGRLAKAALGVRPVLIDTEELELAHVGLGIDPLVERLLRGFDSMDVAARRRQNFERLAGLLDGSVPLVHRSLSPGVCPLSLPIRVTDKVRMQADLLRAGIHTVNFWSQHHPDLPSGAFPEVDRLRAEVLEVPVHQDLGPEHIDYVGETVRKVLRPA